MPDITTGIVIVDHGSTLQRSNAMLEQLAELFARRFAERYPIVEPAHMELAEPSIATAYARCVQRGAQRIIICPFFLGPGKHWTHDIPRLTAQVGAKFPETVHHVAPTLGIDDLIMDLMAKRIDGCRQDHYHCEQCRPDDPSAADPIFCPPKTCKADRPS